MSERNFETIVEGAFYRMANGEVVGPANRRHDRSNEAKSPWEVGNRTYTEAKYPWEVGNRTYTQDGYCHYSKQEFKYNLIARVNQDGTPWVEQTEPAPHEPPIDEAIEAQQFGDAVDDIIEELEIRAIWRIGAVEVYVDDGKVGHNIIGRGQQLSDLPILARLYDRAHRRWSAICSAAGKERGNGNS